MVTLGQHWGQTRTQPPLTTLTLESRAGVRSSWPHCSFSPLLLPFLLCRNSCAYPRLAEPIRASILMENTPHEGRTPQQQVAAGGGHCRSPPGVLAAHGASLALDLQPLPAGTLQSDAQWTACSTSLPRHLGAPNVLARHGSLFNQEQGCYSKELNFIHRTPNALISRKSGCIL